jgi:hypothetical protein
MLMTGLFRGCRDCSTLSVLAGQRDGLDLN